MLRGITPKSVLEHLLFAVIGGWLYMAIEVMWRGYTHWSMGVLGGVCFVAVGLLNETASCLTNGTGRSDLYRAGAAGRSGAERLARS